MTITRSNQPATRRRLLSAGLGIGLRMNGGHTGGQLGLRGGQGKCHPQDYRATVLNLGTTHTTLWTTKGGLTRGHRCLSTIHRTYHHFHLSKAQSVSS